MPEGMHGTRTRRNLVREVIDIVSRLTLLPWRTEHLIVLV